MKKLLLSLLGVLAALPIIARDFDYTYEGQTITYTVIDEDAKTCMTKAGGLSAPGNNISGDLILPENPKDGDIEYLITEIGEYGFYNCKNLYSISIPQSIKKIGTCAFYVCDGLKKAEFSTIEHLFEIQFGEPGVAGNWEANPLIYAKNLYINGLEIKDIIIPSSVNKIREDVLHGSGVESITIPNTVMEIEPGAFWFCSELKELIIEDNDIPLDLGNLNGGQHLFEGTKLEKVYLGRDLSYICNSRECSPFFNSNNTNCYFNSLTIGPTVTLINDYCFSDCNALTSIKCLAQNPPILGIESFSSDTYANSAVFVPEDELINYRNDWSAFQHFINGELINASYTIKEAGTLKDWVSETDLGRIISLKLSGPLNGSDLITLNKMVLIEDLDLSDASIVKGGEYYYNYNSTGDNILREYWAFGLKNLKNLKLPNSLRYIGNYGSVPGNYYIAENIFINNPLLKNIVMGNSLEYIEKGSFLGCLSLDRVEFSNLDYLLSIEFGDKESNPISIAQHIIVNGEEITDNLVIPNTVSSINSFALSGCKRLKSVTIPNSVTSIGQGAFSSCTGLNKVEFSSIEHLLSIEFKGGDANPLTYAHHLYINGEEVTDIIIPDNITKINDCVFSGGSELTSIKFNSITEIGSCAFEGCSRLSNIDLPESVTSIGTHAFAECVGLTAIELPNSITSIEYNAFYHCHGIKSVTLPNSLTSIGCVFNHCHGLTQVYIPNSITEIDSWAFEGCGSLKELTIPESVKKIRSSAFAYCEGLKTIVFKGEVNIGEQAFYECPNLETIKLTKANVNLSRNNCFNENVYTRAVLTIPANSLKDILTSLWGRFENIQEEGSDELINQMLYTDGTFQYAFFPDSNEAVLINADYENLTSIEIPNRFVTEVDGEPVMFYVTGIGSNAFRDCTMLESIKFPQKLKSIGASAFEGCSSLSSVELPNTVEIVQSSAFSNCKNLETVFLAESVTMIGAFAFYDCNSLRSINIPASIIEIGEFAFNGCGLKDFRFWAPKIEKIGEFAFSNVNVVEIVLPPTIETCSCAFGWVNLKKGAYPDKFDQTPIYSNTGIIIAYPVESVIIDKVGIYTPDGDGLLYAWKDFPGEFVVPETVLYIGNGAFYDCDYLTSVVIPESVEKIGSFAFKQCDNLTAVNIPNSVIELGGAAFSQCDLHSVSLGSSLHKIDNFTFDYNYNLKSIEIPNSVTEIGIDAFACDESLTSIVLPNALTTLDGAAFYGCSALRDVRFGGSIESIGDATFRGCNLEEVVLPPSVTSVGAYAFANNERLKTVKIGHGISEIGENAFSGCSNIENIYIASQEPPKISANTFPSVNIPLWLSDEEAYEAFYDCPRTWYQFENNMFTMIPVTEVSTETSEVSGMPGSTIKFEAKIVPDNATLPHLFWKSTDTSVATVDHDGYVTFNELPEDTEDEVDDTNYYDVPQSCKIIAMSMHSSVPVLEFTASNVPITGIDDIEAGAGNMTGGSTSVYNISGQYMGNSTEGLDAGIYIVRNGTEVSKIAVK